MRLILKAQKNVGTFYAIAASVELIRWHKSVFVQERDKIRENRRSRVASSPAHLTVPVSDSWEQERDVQQILTSATVSFFVPCWKLPKFEMCFYLRVSREVTLETLMGDTNKVCWYLTHHWRLYERTISWLSHYRIDGCIHLEIFMNEWWCCIKQGPQFTWGITRAWKKVDMVALKTNTCPQWINHMMKNMRNV